MKVFLNGNLISSETPLITINDRGFTLGDGIFETIKATPSHVHHFEDHYNRLQSSALFLDIPIPYNCNELLKICQNLIQANRLETEICSIRITLTRGQSARGIAIPNICNPTLLITASAYHPQTDFYPKVFITNIQRNEYSPLTKLKTIQYLESILARKIATEQGYDEAIMLNTKGVITETSIANIFFVKEDRVYTPRLEDGVLPGIIREKIINCCHQLGFSIIEKEILPNEISEFTGAFQTNSLIEIQSLSSINHHILKCGEQAVVTNKIITQYQKLISSSYSTD